MSFYADTAEGSFVILPSLRYWWGGKYKASVSLAWLFWEVGVEWVK